MRMTKGRVRLHWRSDWLGFAGPLICSPSEVNAVTVPTALQHNSPSARSELESGSASSEPEDTHSSKHSEVVWPSLIDLGNGSSARWPTLCTLGEYGP